MSPIHFKTLGKGPDVPLWHETRAVRRSQLWEGAGVVCRKCRESPLEPWNSPWCSRPRGAGPAAHPPPVSRRLEGGPGT